MWRAFFLAIGIFCVIVGAECLVVDKATLATGQSRSDGAGQPTMSAYREITPPPWAPWSLMSVGSVVMLYSFTLPAKLRS